MKGRLLVITFILLMTVLELAGQTYPVYSQYLLDGLVINPAYAGTRDALSTTILYRQKLLGADGSPVMQSFTAHAPLKKERVALGIMAHYQTYGVSHNAGVFAQYAYHITTRRGKWSLGLKAGVDMSNCDYSNVSTVVPDPVFTDAVTSYILPNVGVGVYYYNKKFFAGLSVPMMFSYRENSTRSGYEFYHDYNNYDFLISSGVLISFSEGFRFKPSVLVRYSPDKPILADINGNFIIADFVWLGASYRVGEEVLVGIAEIQITQQLKIGYAYEYSMGGLSSFTSGTHEVGLRMEFGKKVNAANPRYF
ncbi:MAG TPA: type IX secretion system membrane protein PorP/SprF [Bacteroidales bacterium]|nr:type IX secretion system membrane protein PorP/SprF [Bacteroidales bacterium]